MESCQNHFWGTLYTSPPPKKSILFHEQDISLEREFVASQIGDYKKIILIVQTYFGGQSYYPPPFNPPNPVSSKHTAAESGETNDDDAVANSKWGRNRNNPTVAGRQKRMPKKPKT
jgi:hypothetical protein